MAKIGSVRRLEVANKQITGTELDGNGVYLRLKSTLEHEGSFDLRYCRQGKHKGTLAPGPIGVLLSWAQLQRLWASAQELHAIAESKGIKL